MVAVRRVYILAVSAFSLLLVTWAVIALERASIPFLGRAHPSLPRRLRSPSSSSRSRSTSLTGSGRSGSPPRPRNSAASSAGFISTAS